jgi:hypothetical protein
MVNGQLTIADDALPGAALKPLLDAYTGGQPLLIDNAVETSDAFRAE